MLYPSMSLFAFMECPIMTQSFSMFAIKCSWQIVYVLINFAEVVVVVPCMLWVFLPWLDFWPCLLVGCMLSLSWNALCWVHRARKHAFVTLFMPCPVFLLSLNLFIKLATFTWVPSYLLCLFGSWSVREICSMHLVEAWRAFVHHDMFL